MAMNNFYHISPEKMRRDIQRARMCANSDDALDRQDFRAIVTRWCRAQFFTAAAMLCTDDEIIDIMEDIAKKMGALK